MTDTPLDLDYIEHRMASPMVTYRESVEEDMPALVAALRKAEAQVAAVLALCDEREGGVSPGILPVLPTWLVRAALDAHDGDLRERLAGAVEARRDPDAGYADLYGNGYNDGLTDAARIIRERP